MKNLFRPLALVFFAMSVMSNKCEKIDSTPKLDADGLPFVTQTGANTFGCLINGEPFYANLRFPYLEKFYNVSITDAEDSSFYVAVSNVSKYSENSNGILIGIRNDSFYVIGDYYHSDGNHYDLTTNSLNRAKVIDKQLRITKFDIQNQIISGEFDFRIKSRRNGGNMYDTLHFTKGRFDGKW